MSRNWIRSCYIVLNGNSQKVVTGGGPTDLRIKYAIEPPSIQSPNMAHFRIYNPNPTTTSALKAKEYTRLEFYGGYQDNCGLVYSGGIKQSTSGHETAVDSYVDIWCADGDQGYINARVSKTLAAGYTPQDKLQVALDAFAQYGVTLGIVNVDLSTPKYPRGLPMIGMARDVVREIAYSKGAQWSIQDNRINVIDGKKPIQTSTYVMNSKTGMIGWPKQTTNGIEVTSLLNSALRPDTLVQINEASINQAEPDTNTYTGETSQKTFDLTYTGLIAADGLYRIIYMERTGDTRGQEWYDVSMCIAVNGGFLNDAEIEAGYSSGWE